MLAQQPPSAYEHGTQGQGGAERVRAARSHKRGKGGRTTTSAARGRQQVSAFTDTGGTSPVCYLTSSTARADTPCAPPKHRRDGGADLLCSGRIGLDARRGRRRDSRRVRRVAQRLRVLRRRLVRGSGRGGLDRGEVRSRHGGATGGAPGRVALLARDDAGQVVRQRWHGLVGLGIAVVHELHTAARSKGGGARMSGASGGTTPPSTSLDQLPSPRAVASSRRLQDSESLGSCRGSHGAAGSGGVGACNYLRRSWMEAGSTPMQMAVSNLPHGREASTAACQLLRARGGGRARKDAAVGRARCGRPPQPASGRSHGWTRKRPCNLTQVIRGGVGGREGGTRPRGATGARNVAPGRDG